MLEALTLQHTPYQRPVRDFVTPCVKYTGPGHSLCPNRGCFIRSRFQLFQVTCLLLLNAQYQILGHYAKLHYQTPVLSNL